MNIHQKILLSLAFFTRLPVARIDAPPPVWTFPVAGALIGLACGGAYYALYWCGLQSGIAALLAVAAQIGLTGALHEDGLADTADGFGGGKDRESRLLIMRDSRIGSYGALALVFSVCLRSYALMLLSQPAVVVAVCIAAGALSRTMIAVAMFALPHARADGLAAWAGKPSRECVLLSVGIACAVAIIAVHIVALKMIALAAFACAGVCALSKRAIGGATGDVYGAVQQMVEITVLVAATTAY